jgi:hypothetical protein
MKIKKSSKNVVLNLILLKNYDKESKIIYNFIFLYILFQIDLIK